MGGPSVESYRAAEAARKKRLAAMRTRDGVVDLAEWRDARRAAEFLESTHGRLPLLLAIRLLASRSVGFELEVTLVRDDPSVRVCIPSAVNDVPVRIVVRNPVRTSSSVSAPPVPSET
jgi:hypothetical protein